MCGKIKLKYNFRHNNNNDEISIFFPSFIWVVRDFALDLGKSDGNEVYINKIIIFSLDNYSGIYGKLLNS